MAAQIAGMGFACSDLPYQGSVVLQQNSYATSSTTLSGQPEAEHARVHAFCIVFLSARQYLNHMACSLSQTSSFTIAIIATSALY